MSFSKGIKPILLQKLKNLISRLYVKSVELLYLYSRKKKQVNKYLRLSDGDNATFFGYHDKTPFSADGSKILAMSIEADDCKPESECTRMKLGYFKKNETGSFENQFISFAETTTWCFQQGCMLQWHPLNANDLVIFNRIVNGNYGSILFDIQKEEIVREYNYPVYSLDPTGKYAASLNFSRLGRLRPGYGYRLILDQTEGIPAPENDGLFLVNLQTGVSKLLISLFKLASENGNPKDEHYVNHASFSPDGKNLVFFHIWITKDKKRKIRFCCYNLESNTYSVLDEIKTVSHFCWMNNSEILASTKVLKESMKLSIYNIHNGKSKEIFELANGDTHPMQSPINRNQFILDCYPDKLRNQHLFLFNIKKLKIKKLESYFSPFKFTGQVRCDLHPRWDRKGNFVVMDSAIEKVRKLLLVDMSNYQI
jgi:hypothetical protein